MIKVYARVELNFILLNFFHNLLIIIFFLFELFLPMICAARWDISKSTFLINKWPLTTYPAVELWCNFWLAFFKKYFSACNFIHSGMHISLRIDKKDNCNRLHLWMQWNVSEESVYAHSISEDVSCSMNSF